MPRVVDWAERNGVGNVILLHCPEHKYSPEFARDIEKMAHELFPRMQQQLKEEGRNPLHFELLLTEGLLHEHLATLIAAGDIVMVFAGMKMLDYRLAEIKKLKAPFFFLGD